MEYFFLKSLLLLLAVALTIGEVSGSLQIGYPPSPVATPTQIAEEQNSQEGNRIAVDLIYVSALIVGIFVYAVRRMPRMKG
jgi:hypothetical protein